MSESTLALSIPIIGTIGLFVMIIFIRKYQNDERMAMIEKGISTDFFSKAHAVSGTLRASLMLIGVGIGFLLGYLLDRSLDMEEVGYFSMIFIFGGIGLGAAYFIEEARNKKERDI
ncbi:DUF6249 domain-containing protein [Chryseosolibacter indicus]|uniref:DUF6249 domain-containing protein n=1 Tax=Chryseosolibacter indicus TaxID=2782351 RepID=A0ABS5VM29_9BACT|nr:DUF6249 domain-containing protein [Chryseosolibacter indicus]MBT1702513.1 hypothetical protein [Chryseosolibacter indicus]